MINEFDDYESNNIYNIYGYNNNSIINQTYNNVYELALKKLTDLANDYLFEINKTDNNYQFVKVDKELFCYYENKKIFEQVMTIFFKDSNTVALFTDGNNIDVRLFKNNKKSNTFLQFNKKINSNGFLFIIIDGQINIFVIISKQQMEMEQYC